MLTSEMKEGNKISVLVNKFELESEIQIIRDEYILVTILLIDDKIVKFPADLKVDMIYYGDDNSLYIWENVVVSPVKFKNGQKYHKIDLPKSEGKRYNRRGNYRLYVGKDMSVEFREGTSRKRKKTLVKDISATGFAFLNNEDYDVGLRVSLIYDIVSGKRMNLSGKIVRKQYMDNINSTLYGCQFTTPSDEIRKIINREQQRMIKEKLQ